MTIGFTGRCAACGYDLAAIPATPRCPECGVPLLRVERVESIHTVRLGLLIFAISVAAVWIEAVLFSSVFIYSRSVLGSMGNPWSNRLALAALVLLMSLLICSKGAMHLRAASALLRWASVVGLALVTVTMMSRVLEGRLSYSGFRGSVPTGSPTYSGTEWVVPILEFAGIVYLPLLLASITVWLRELSLSCGVVARRRLAWPVVIAMLVGIGSFALPQGMEWFWREYSRPVQFPFGQMTAVQSLPWHTSLVNPATARIVALIGQSLLVFLSIWMCMSALRLRVRLRMLSERPPDAASSSTTSAS